MQGQPFLLTKEGVAPRQYAFSARDRMDETYDRIRSLRNDRYRYVRNYCPELPYFQYINYMDEMPIMRTWRRLAFEGKLDKTQDALHEPHQAEGRTLRPRIRPLRSQQHHRRGIGARSETRKELSDALDKWVKDTGDLGEVTGKGTDQARDRAGRALDGI